VTIEALKAEFTTPAWQSLAETDSGLNQLLCASYFKNEEKGHTAE